MSDASTPDPVRFDGLFPQPLLAVFDQPDSSSDAGAVLIRALDERLGLTRALALALTERRSTDRVQHTLHDVVQQRVYAIACGYEDANDAARLRSDPTQKLLLDRDPLAGAALASQPTLSRFENALSARELLRLGIALGERVIERQRRRLGARVKRITIDLDGTDDPTHGQQQGALWNGHYRGFCYLPLLGTLQFDREREQHLFAALLRPGNASPRSGAIALLRRTLPRLRAAFPRARLRVRLDGGFAAPDVFDFLEREGVEYLVAMGSNSTLARLAEPLLQRAREASNASGKSERVYGHAQYRARTCPHDRRVVIKGEVTRYPGRAPRDNPRFVITNISSDQLVAAGATILALGRTREHLEDVARACADLPGEVLPFVGDVRNDASVQHAIDIVIDRFGRLDGWVNNASTASGGGALGSLSRQGLNAATSGLTDVMMATQTAADAMVRLGRPGSIVQISSMYGVVSPTPTVYADLPEQHNPPAYGAVKAGILQFTRYAAVHLAPHGVRVNAVTPGAFPEPQVQRHETFIERLSERIPMARVGHPRELAGAVHFLLSDAATYMTGSNIVVDGGWTAW